MSSSATLSDPKSFHSSSFPTSLPSPPADAAPPPIPRKASPTLRQSLRDLDRTISRLQILFSTPAGTDHLVRTIGYILQFTSATATSPRLLPYLLALSTKLSSLALTVLPGPVSEKGLGLVVAGSGYATSLPARAAALAGLISDYRMFVRLWGLLGMYAWGKGLTAQAPADPVLRVAAWGQMSAYTAYQFLENRGYLASRGVLKREGKDIMADFLWSSRMWMVGVGWEFVRLWRVRQLWAASAAADEEKRGKEVEQWKRDLVVNLTNAPLTAHYSVAGGMLGNGTIGLLGAIGGLVGLNERWKVTGAQVKAS